MITEDQARRVFRKYAEICGLYGQSMTEADIDHSSLLSYMLAGSRPLPIPAPTFYSYPCYELGEGKEIESPTIFTYKEGDGERIVIGQNGDFTKIDDRTVRYSVTGEIFRFDKPIPDRYEPPGFTVGQKPPHPDEFLHIKKVPIRAKTVKCRDLPNRAYHKGLGLITVSESKTDSDFPCYMFWNEVEQREAAIDMRVCEIVDYEIPSE